MRQASTARPDIGSALLNDALSQAKAATPTKPITRPTTREPLGLSPSQAQATSAPHSSKDSKNSEAKNTRKKTP